MSVFGDEGAVDGGTKGRFGPEGGGGGEGGGGELDVGFDKLVVVALNLEIDHNVL
jgi:hypothetical protein